MVTWRARFSRRCSCCRSLRESSSSSQELCRSSALCHPQSVRRPAARAAGPGRRPGGYGFVHAYASQGCGSVQGVIKIQAGFSLLLAGRVLPCSHRRRHGTDGSGPDLLLCVRGQRGAELTLKVLPQLQLRVPCRSERRHHRRACSMARGRSQSSGRCCLRQYEA